jgi:hypothetical protein
MRHDSDVGLHPAPRRIALRRARRKMAARAGAASGTCRVLVLISACYPHIGAIVFRYVK